MPKIGNDDNRIHFCQETNAKGYTYIKCYKTKWDKIKKRSFAYGRVHVGRLFPNGWVKLSDRFKSEHPEYSEGNWYWSPEKTLVIEHEFVDNYPGVFPQEKVDELGEAILEVIEEREIYDGATWLDLGTYKHINDQVHLLLYQEKLPRSNAHSLTLSGYLIHR